MNARCQIVIGLLVVVVLILGWLLVGEAKGRAMLEARHHAGVRLLSEFQCSFLRSHDISVADYYREYSEFREEYPSQHLLNLYGHYLAREKESQSATP